ncbi:MAG: 3-deoxy-8-phosphooctulonate synthase [Candidatus Cloacimonadota bacterium]|nr:MAG: 3-deoxy-8-phosphooctulonate synthase [Candidatus Cloacimonadota bacterium]
MIQATNIIKLNDKISIGGKSPFVLLAGPCVAESKELLFLIAKEMKAICEDLDIPYVFKASFDKANRSSINGYRGPGIEKGLAWLQEVKDTFGLPIVTDIHNPNQCEQVAKVADILQIPAFLCRQTDLVKAAAETGKIINVKKGQFLSPWEVQNIIDKVKSCGNDKVMITERGCSFGYNNLVVDQRSFPVIRNMGVPVVFDGTHSVQLPGGLGSSTGGQREFIPNLTRAAVANGIDVLFMEVHPKPEEGLSDPTTMYQLDKIRDLLTQLKKIDQLIKGY